MWDELTTLIKSFGLYKSGGGDYDRSIFLTLYNGPDRLLHQTKKYKINIENPRLSIFAPGHPHKIIDLLKTESNFENCDGFISRFLIFNPVPLRIRLSNFLKII
jgi:hypothetical protein